MKNKILGILVCMLLIAVTVFPVAGTTNNNKIFDGTSADYIYSSVQETSEACFIMEDWQEQAKLLASDGETNDRLGLSLLQ